MPLRTGSPAMAVPSPSGALRLGPVLGARTWGGVIGIDGYHRLVEGTGITGPRDATWLDTLRVGGGGGAGRGGGGGGGRAGGGGGGGGGRRGAPGPRPGRGAAAPTARPARPPPAAPAPARARYRARHWLTGQNAATPGRRLFR